jgi:hypothetical protein
VVYLWVVVLQALRLLGEKRRIGLSWVIDVVLYLGASNKSSLETSRYRGLILSSLTLDQGIFPMVSALSTPRTCHNHSAPLQPAIIRPIWHIWEEFRG